MRFRSGTFVTGLVFLAISVVFILEALGIWEIRVTDLRFLGPLALVLIGLAVMVGALTRRRA